MPERFNIGVACTDAHLGTPGRGPRGDDRRGRRARHELDHLPRARRAHQPLRPAAARPRASAPGERVLIRLPNSHRLPDRLPRRDEARRDERAHLDAAHRRGGASTSRTTPARRRSSSTRPRGKAMGAKLAGPGALRFALLSGAGEVTPAPGRRGRSTSRRRSPAIGALRAAARHRRRRPGLPRLHLGHHRLPEGRAARPPLADRAHAGGALLVRFPRAWRPRRRRLPGRATASCTPASSTGPTCWAPALMDPLYHGKTVIAHEGKNDAETWPRLIAKHGATIFIGVPTIYRQILQKTAFADARRADAAPLHERGRAPLRRGASGCGRTASASTSSRRSA